ncbi:coiled-coil domain-containing protein 81-like isoform 2-T2 [Menidia menidia]
MAELLLRASEADRRTLPTLSQLSQSDIDCIWAEISSYIKHQISSQKGVRLSGLGTFTLSQQNLYLGNRFRKVHGPVFIAAGKLARSLGLKETRPPATVTRLPVVQLNFAAVSQKTPFSRDVVEGCVRETLQLLLRALASDQNASLVFKGLGVLSFKKNKVQMNFTRDFFNVSDGGVQRGTGLKASDRPSGPQRPETADRAALPALRSPRNDGKAGGKDGGPAEQRDAGEVPKQRESESRKTMQPAKVKAVDLIEELNPKPPAEAPNKLPTSNSSQVVSSKLSEHLLNMSCSDNTHDGQGLCHLCERREKRNVPVYLSEQRQAKEKVQEKMLLLKEQLKDEQDVERELAKVSEQRAYARQVAAFNLNISKKRTTSSYVVPNSFIFPGRPFTPPRRIQQHRYMSRLQSQIETRKKREAQTNRHRYLTENLDQVQLIQELALQRAQQLQQKQEKTHQYRKALDTQVEDKKHTETPDGQHENLGLNRCDTAVSDTERRDRAQKVTSDVHYIHYPTHTRASQCLSSTGSSQLKAQADLICSICRQLFQVNFGAAVKRKEGDLQIRQLQLQKEREMLRHNKMELILDRVSRFEKKRDISKLLEDDWSRSIRLKHKREDEEKKFQRLAGQLLVDKLTEYRRCSQCQRRTNNCGQTNIWKDSHYLSGSQFMI